MSRSHCRYGSFGLGGADPNSLTHSAVTEAGYLCHLGLPRRQLSSIVIQSANCFLQIASRAGDGYTAMLRSAAE